MENEIKKKTSRTDGLKKKLANAEERIKMLETSLEEERALRVKKDRIAAQIDKECDDKLANARLIQRGLEANLRKANERIAVLEKQLAVQTKSSWLKRLFKKGK